MFNTHICKNCFQSYSGKPEVCPNCGAPTKYRKEIKQEVDDQNFQNNTSNESFENNEIKQKKRKKHLTDQEIMDSINFEDLVARTNDDSVKSWREKKKKKNKEKLDVTVGEDGEYDIDTKDVTYLPQTYNYSVKKARGEYQKPDIKWWEIYKWADLMLARRKIKKQVNRASQFKPQVFSRTTTIILCILFGWMGAHNFYVRNYKKGWLSLFCAVVGTIVAVHPALRMIQVSIGGLLLFIATIIWIIDLINLIFGTFTYRLSKWKFIDNLNTDTRGKLGFKYVDKDEYKKPWIVRVFHSIKRNAEESKLKKAEKQQAASGEEVIEPEIEQENVQVEKTQPAKETNKNTKKTKNKPKIIKNNKNRKK